MVIPYLLFTIIGLLIAATIYICTQKDVHSLDDTEIVSTKALLQPISELNDGMRSDYWPKLDFQLEHDPFLEKKIADLVNTMTLEQKIAQMIQPEIRDISVADMRKYGFGSYLNGGGSFPNNNKQATPSDWIKLAENMYQASIDASLDGSNIPTMWGTDAVHGHNNVIGATLFPHNIGLGAANNPELIEQIATATATEVMVTGIDWVFAPTVAVVRDDRWGRTYEGYSEDPEIVRAYAHAIVEGLQGAVSKDFMGDRRVIATVKHFLGDGGTKAGDDQGNNLASEKELFNIHAQGYVSGLAAGAQTVMASFNSWHGTKNHGNKYLLTDVLKTRLGFDGLVVGDWNGHGQVKGCSNEKCSQSINAGLDIFMVPTKAWKPLYENTINQVKHGEIPLERINDAVSRILRVKMRAGLFDKPSPANRALSGKTELIGSDKHRALARRAVRESLVLLKNKNQLLPLSQHQNILITGDGANNIGKQSGGWSITWQGTNNTNDDFPGGTSIYQGIKKKLYQADGLLELSIDGNFNQRPDVAIVVFGEEPYAEGNGDLDNLDFQRGNKKDLALIERLKSQNIPVVSVFISGRPLSVNAELNASDAFVAAWLPGTEGAGIADVLIRKSNDEIDYDFIGKLSYSWPASPDHGPVNRFDNNYQPLLPYGFGLTYSDKNLLDDNLPVFFDNSQKELPVIKLLESPWRPAFQSGDGETLIANNQQSNKIMSYRTIDRLVQEDARQLSFSGKAVGSFEINDNFPFDLRGYFENNSTLSLDFLIEMPPTQPVYIGMRCEQPCNAEIDISKYLSSVEPGEWHSVSIDLACFAQLGATMDKIFAPFVIKTSAKLEINYSNLEIIPQSAKDATYPCAVNET